MKKRLAGLMMIRHLDSTIITTAHFSLKIISVNVIRSATEITIPWLEKRIPQTFCCLRTPKCIQQLPKKVMDDPSKGV